MTTENKTKTPSENLEALAEVILSNGSKADLIKSYLKLTTEERVSLMRYMDRMTEPDLYRAIRNHAENLGK